MDKPELTAVVVAGAGARGAYAAGALAAVLPQLLPDGLGSTIFLGTSAGAINVALWAARAHEHRDLRQLGEAVKRVWLGIHRPQVFELDAPDVARWGGELALELGRIGFGNMLGSRMASLRGLVRGWPGMASFLSFAERGLGAAVGGASGLLGRPFAGTLAHTPGLLDTRPLARSAERLVDFAALNDNIRKGLVGGVGLVATSCPMDASGGRSRVFLKTADGLVPLPSAGSSIDYVRTDELKAEHVLASAAIPVAFPTVRIDMPPCQSPDGLSAIDYSGWYTDGGVRLNAPIEPAIKLGAKRIILITSHAAQYPAPKNVGRVSRPGLLDVSAQPVHAVMADAMIEDLRLLRRVNAMVADAKRQNAVLTTERGRPYREIELVVIAPDNGTLSPLAEQAEQRVLSRGVALDVTLSRMFSVLGRGDGRNELLSYLLFEPEYFALQFAQAERDVRKLLGRGSVPPHAGTRSVAPSAAHASTPVQSLGSRTGHVQAGTSGGRWLAEPYV